MEFGRIFLGPVQNFRYLYYHKDKFSFKSILNIECKNVKNAKVITGLVKLVDAKTQTEICPILSILEVFDRVCIKL